MRTLDHLILGKKLCKNVNKQLGQLEKAAFYIGCILPDVLPITYLHKFLKGERFKGHNFLNTLEHIKRYMFILFNPTFFLSFNYLILGILIHYVSDAFTFPHNYYYKDSLKKHMEYESLLHFEFVFSHHISSNETDYPLDIYRLYEYYILMHKQYDNEVHNTTCDFRYINKVCEHIMKVICHKISTITAIK